ncbi:hypothetical protein GKZ89_04245 [Bacillus mangrovi]|uniref:Uncharacterized protein n=1 Tax=Metabacillus mangrovi TaxID=1491830 RepID=A0A7X2S2Q6_9BACI|nr:hypothetical protein [Metabacillus mangrovi]MTH52608.1 hypothetical protein [Metabacillus mangrovi]
MPGELDAIWEVFLSELAASSKTADVQKKMIAGIPFLYIKDDHLLSLEPAEDLISQAARKAMLYKKVSCKTVFVRKENSMWIFRHRFYVPQEKMFCCGNLCEDCILLKQ